MKASTQEKNSNSDDFALLEGEYITLMEFIKYQLSVLIIERLGITRHFREFQDWLVSAAVPLSFKLDLCERIFKEHPQLNQFRPALRALQPLWDFENNLTGSRTSSATTKSHGEETPTAYPITLEELKSRLGELRDVEDLIGYMNAVV